MTEVQRIISWLLTSNPKLELQNRRQRDVNICKAKLELPIWAQEISRYARQDLNAKFMT